MNPRTHLSLIVLIVANVLPIVGVVHWGWNVFEIVVLYWFENLVLGVINVLKMLTCCPEPEEKDASGQPLPDYLQSSNGSALVHHGSKLFLIPFFTLHYGGFCAGHGVFVFAMLGPKTPAGGDADPFKKMADWFSSFPESDIKWFALAIMASHLFSFFHNYIGKGEFRKTTPPELMHAPYGRIVVLHLAIIFGGFVVQAMGSSVGMLTLLIIGKIIIDAKLHLRAHKKLEVNYQMRE
jgi:hypothetical protein